VAVLAHPKNAYSIVYEHHTIAVGIDPALGTSALPQGLDVAFPEAVPVKTIEIVTTVINILVLCCLCCCYRSSASVAALGGRRE
jgi:hypothetical protein